MRRLLATGFITLYFVLSSIPVQAATCLKAVDEPGCMYGLPADQYQALLPVMQANPAPALAALPPSMQDIDRYSDKTKGGTVINRPSLFTGRLLNGGFPFEAAWVIHTTQTSALPGAKPDKDAPKVHRYSLVYIFATVKAKKYAWFLIGPGQWIERRKVALIKMPTRPDSATGKWVAVDTAEQVLFAYEGDRPVFLTLISSGLYKHPTRKGLFHIKTHLLTDDMRGAMGTPEEYSISYVPYVMYFDGDISLHGAFWHDLFGLPHSHGCVNMTLTDARWMFEWTQNTDTLVYVWRSR